MKVGILVMATLEEPSTSNIKAIKDTVVKYVSNNKNILKHEYDFYFYYADESRFTNNTANTIIEKESNIVYNIYINTPESIYRTFEKTYYAFYSINEEYDWFIRINISSFINIKLVDKVIDELEVQKIYCSAINTIVDGGKYNNEIYPRGDFFVISKKVINDIKPKMKELLYNDTSLENRLDAIHVDDVLIGITLCETYGKNYFNNIISLKYGFFPQNDGVLPIQLARNVLCNRVKTIPPNINYSGYSWKDNDYRRKDIEKMHSLNLYYKNINYDNVYLKDIIADESICRKTILTLYKEASITQIKEFLKIKKEGN